jgi:hypothetical protein
LILLIAYIAIVVFICGIGSHIVDAQNSSSKTSSRPSAPSFIPSPLTVNGIECNANEQFLFHIHAHLNIFVNGQLMYIPPQIGIIPEKCIYWLHTHDETGIIHIESPIKTDFTLGQFLDLWKKKLNNPGVYDTLFNGKGNMPQIYINGDKLPSGTDYRDVKLHAHDEIVLIYGILPANIPSKYDFPQGL